MQNDSRSAVWEQVIDIIQDQSKKNMGFFILENVMGQAHKSPDSAISFMEQSVLRIQQTTTYLVSVFELDSRDFHLPQHRRRIYIVGVNQKYVSLPVPCPSPLPEKSVSELWADILHPAVENDRPRPYMWCESGM